jgi:hypothetical protein
MGDATPYRVRDSGLAPPIDKHLRRLNQRTDSQSQDGSALMAVPMVVIVICEDGINDVNRPARVLYF